MRRMILACIASVVLVLASMAPASADTLTVRSAWRDCGHLASGLLFRTVFPKPAVRHGEGRYLIKSQIRWDRLKAGGEWRAADVNTIQTPWTFIRNPQFDFGLTHGDRTKWGAWYDNGWRAHVIVKLIKNRRGPLDKRVATVERFFSKGFFSESCRGGR